MSSLTHILHAREDLGPRGGGGGGGMNRHISIPHQGRNYWGGGGGAELVMRVLMYMVAMTRIMTQECALPDHALYTNYSWT